MTTRNNVAWRNAWADGLRIAITERSLVAVAALAGVADGVFAIWRLQPGLTRQDIEAFAEAAAKSLRQNPLGAYRAFTVPDDVAQGVVLTAMLLLLGMALLVGLLGLLRDLLVRDRYYVRDLPSRTRRYFWRMIAFKFPFYLVLGAIFLASVMLAWPHGAAAGSRPWLMGGLATYGIAFGVARVFLSLGAKVLVAEEMHGARAICGRVVTLISPHLCQVTKFYCATLVVVAVGVALSLGVSRLPVGPGVRLGAALLLAGFVTVLVKAATFSFYLQLSAARSSPTGHRQVDGTPALQAASRACDQPSGTR